MPRAILGQLTLIMFGIMNTLYTRAIFYGMHRNEAIPADRK
jgi:hypothetical protein